MEVVISLTLMAVIIVLMMGGFRLGVSAWEKGERGVESRQRYRIVLDLVNTQIISVVPVVDPSQMNFKGDAKSMAFCSMFSIVPGNGSVPVYVKYRVGTEKTGEGESLFLFEKNLLFVKASADDAMDVEREDFVRLISGAVEIHFEYLPEMPDKGKVEWLESWDWNENKKMPSAVKLFIKKKSSEDPVVVIARIESKGFKVDP
ncbi:hypothetical protein [Desulforapulum autotrophicum]|nr:hypothetical protein [Desulforapulum autotrophicum]